MARKALRANEHIELYRTIAHHPKTYALAHILNQRRSTVIGMLCLLWLWPLDNKSGLIDLDAASLAEIMAWPDEPGRLVKALVACRWLDNKDGVLYIHDWSDYAGRLLLERQARREQNRQRQERFRQKLYRLLHRA